MTTATKTKWNAHGDYQITAANKNYTGKSNRVPFDEGKARLYGLPKDATEGEVADRVDQLQWFANAGVTTISVPDDAGNPVRKVVPVYRIEELDRSGKVIAPEPEKEIE